ncbi:hypothetical protein A2982_00315 [candidate division WWE3 bacterium RIFCSPLOWO2_01_FULL_39_13]|uniref:Peptidyl-tRNA hydrolase n=1 Tax=candidate division WWE3 bacterium RIFCSPLOWO2_01_FULL_39_13 TaxID=1802624 RepID=A0A1F4V4D9_UNCKA|nr:MAG: hypothetical protein A2982_00315 [candidate division WWE3 bacterium RIFCSPLOWO2_01_FULL_39_13]
MDMELIVGLGNPEPEHSWARHNMGKETVNELKRIWFSDAKWELDKKLGAEICKSSVESLQTVFGEAARGASRLPSDSGIDLPAVSGVVLAKPLCFMNEIGGVVKKLVEYYDVGLKNVVIVYDELDLSVGEYKLVFDRGSHIHNGILSVENHLKSKSFWHLRVGVRDPKIPDSVQKTGRDPSKYVLHKLSSGDKKKILKMINESITAELNSFLSKKI